MGPQNTIGEAYVACPGGVDAGLNLPQILAPLAMRLKRASNRGKKQIC